ncbi:MAG TPA: TetR family transcriptional regulator [Bryobacteraceae bacterium]|nr:TetR family transcriptional regulator [Bryobacteraceae bacterium]
MKPSKQPKSAETRAKILDAALELFREKGFAETSMREVAARAQVATGLAYYYFASKDAIVLAFYQQAKIDMGPLLDEAQTGKKLEARLAALVQVKLRYFAPNRKFLGALMGHAADPANPLSPFAEQSREVREQDMAQFARALAETGTSVPEDMAEALPQILWMYQMGMILFWIYDRSEEQTRTARLLEVSVRMVALLVKLSGIPLAKPARKAVLELVEIVAG